MPLGCCYCAGALLRRWAVTKVELAPLRPCTAGLLLLHRLAAAPLGCAKVGLALVRCCAAELWLKLSLRRCAAAPLGCCYCTGWLLRRWAVGKVGLGASEQQSTGAKHRTSGAAPRITGAPEHQSSAAEQRSSGASEHRSHAAEPCSGAPEMTQQLLSPCHPKPVHKM